MTGCRFLVLFVFINTVDIYSEPRIVLGTMYIVLVLCLSTSRDMISFYFLFKRFIYFWLCWVSVASSRLSLVVVSGGYSVSMQRVGFSLRWLLLLGSMGSRVRRLQ